MDKIVNRFNDLKKQVKVSDETVALLVVAEKLQLLVEKVTALDGEQVGILKKGLDGIAESVQGVGGVIDK